MASSGTSFAGWVAQQSAGGLEDDLLDLSRRLANGFVVRALKFPLYITFKLWLAAARWGPAPLLPCQPGALVEGALLPGLRWFCRLPGHVHHSQSQSQCAALGAAMPACMRP